jgi:hypothetical protein
MSKKIFIAVLAYDYRVDAGNALSLIQNCRYLDRKGIEPVLHFEVGSCYLPYARTKCLMKFLESDCTDLCFVDSDVIFQLNSIYKLSSHNVDFIAGIYPLKQDKEDYPVGILMNKGKAVQKDELIQASWVPTGLMLLSRNCIDVMAAAYPETKFIDGMQYLFDTGDLFGQKNWTGEDVSFCIRWRSLNGKIWVDPDITFGHTSRKEYVGNLKSFLEKEGKL